jgi:aquaporin Z
MMSHRLWAEAFGTFCLVFAGTGAVVIDEATGGSVSHVGVALTFGLVVMVLVYALGRVSGCHINPAVTLGLFTAGKFPAARVVPYVVSQCLGALAASGVLRLLFPESVMLGATVPAGSAVQALVLEFMLTGFLMFVILSMSKAEKAEQMLTGLVVGAVIGLEALFAGPITGASMNPARSLGPAVVSLQLGSVWIYLVAPIAGAVASVSLWRCIHGSADCSALESEGCT